MFEYLVAQLNAGPGGQLLQLLAVLVAGPVAAGASPGRPWRFGIDGQLSTVPSATESWEGLFLLSLALSRELGPGLRAGINHVSIGTASLLTGDRAALMGGPFVEARAASLGGVEPFGAVGVPLQLRWGGGIDSQSGVAVYAGGGLRFRASEGLSLGVETRLTRVMTEAWLHTPKILPEGATIWSLGVMLGVEW